MHRTEIQSQYDGFIALQMHLKRGTSIAKDGGQMVCLRPDHETFKSTRPSSL